MYFLEKLNLRTWFLGILPYLYSRRQGTHRESVTCYFLEGSDAVFLVARALGRLLGVRVERLVFRLVDVRDSHGVLVEGRLRFRDLFDFQEIIRQQAAFKEVVGEPAGDLRLERFLTKAIVRFARRGVLLVNIAAWQAKRMGYDSCVLLTGRCAWLGALQRYASPHGVEVAGIAPAWEIAKLAREWIGPMGVEILRFLRDGLFYLRSILRWRLKGFAGFDTTGIVCARKGNEDKKSPPIIAVQYYGHLNLDRPELYSDLFFWQRSTLSGSEILVAFQFPQDPLDPEKYSQMATHGIRAIALMPQAAAFGGARVFLHRPALWAPAREGRPKARPKDGSQELKWLKNRIGQYEAAQKFWSDFFSRENIKVSVSWFKHDEQHIALAEAIKSVGGVATLYQRSYEPHPSPLISAVADVYFGFSRSGADVVRGSGSRVKYYVTTGYLGDHRISLLRAPVQEVRDGLRRCGAKKIIAYFDENSLPDSRWHTGHEFMRFNYEFLLTKVLEESWLGLLVKPKVPRNLRERLGPVAALLSKAESTGRCYVYEGGVFHGSYPPAVAALASDLAIHGHLIAATAGLEAALAGVPSLLLDREGWHVSPLYGLGVGRVVFTNWEDLWRALIEHWSKPDGIPGFGDWSAMLEELDPFRDGRAAERMGTYLKWLMDGFKASLDRERVMANAAEQYARAWGWDKIAEVSPAREPAVFQQRPTRQGTLLTSGAAASASARWDFGSP